MMPLCTTTMRPVQSRCGCAFSSVGRPCVAQRVCPMPYSPSSGLVGEDVLEARQLAGAAAQLDVAVAGRPRRPPSRSRGTRAAAGRR